MRMQQLRSLIRSRHRQVVDAVARSPGGIACKNCLPPGHGAPAHDRISLDLFSAFPQPANSEPSFFGLLLVSVRLGALVDQFMVYQIVGLMIAIPDYQ